MNSAETTGLDRFTAPRVTAEKQLQDQTVGLVALPEFRKRTAQALESSNAERSGSTTPLNDEFVTSTSPILSFSFLTVQVQEYNDSGNTQEED